jgi:hypothetical protein
MTWGKTPHKLANETTSVFCPHVHDLLAVAVIKRRVFPLAAYNVIE